MHRRRLMTAACLALAPRLGRAQALGPDVELIRAAQDGEGGRSPTGRG